MVKEFKGIQTIYLSQDVREKLIEMAKDDGISMSLFIEKLIRQEYDRRKNKNVQKSVKDNK